jgi:hypothetical protein
MNKADIKSVIGKVVPDKEMEQRMTEQVLQKPYKKFDFKKIASVAASIVIVASLGILGYKLTDKKDTYPPVTASSGQGIYIPKIELSNKSNGKADMIGLIVYQGRIYTQSSTRISPDNVKKLLDKKLGTTKGSIDEWSKQKDYDVEFASSIGKADVYSVKGYDKNYRIMTFDEKEGTIYAEFFECFNGITVTKGDDVFGKLKIENNISSAKLEKFESWDNNKQQYKALKNLQTLDTFISKLKNTTPYAQESLSNLFTDQGDTNQKFIYITLKDGSQVELRLFKDGYVFYGSSHIFFKMDNKIFNKLWDELE